jgi:hypothetical protein
MSQANPNWARWIQISVIKVFQTMATANNVHLFIEGQERKTQNYSQYFELRTDGPHFRETSRGHFKIDFEINVLFTSHMSTTTMYTPQQLAGLLEQTMNDICVYRYGDGVDDDDTFLGVLQIVMDKRNSVRTNQFGQIRPDTDIVQGTVEGTFKMHLTL